MKKCRPDGEDKSELSSYIKNIKLALHGTRSWSFKHVQHTANMLADRIATESLRTGAIFYIVGMVGFVPRFAVATMENDYVREPY